MIGLDGLLCVGVMADKGIGTCVYQTVGIKALCRNRLQRVLATPVQRDVDDRMRVALSKTVNTKNERIHRLLTHAGTVFEIGEVLKR